MSLFSEMFPTPLNTEITIEATIYLSSAKAFILGPSKITSFGNELYRICHELIVEIKLY